MKKTLIILGIILSSIIAIAAVSYATASNNSNEFEQAIDAKYKDNQSVHSNYTLTVKEAAHVSDKYSQALSDVMAKALDARYGDEGSKAMFQMIKEQNPNLDPSIYIKLQQIIESGRKEFKVSQTTLLDQCRIYKTQSGYLWTGFWMRMAGYPKEGLEKKCSIIQSDYSKKAYETGVETGVDF